jgi:hypothetical protein
MKTRLSQLEADILVGLIGDLNAIQAKGQPSGYGYSPEKRAWSDVRQGLVRCNPSQWTECDLSDPTQRVAVSRAYKRLESRGLVERFAEGGHVTTHLAPTEAGKGWIAANEATTDA